MEKVGYGVFDPSQRSSYTGRPTLHAHALHTPYRSAGCLGSVCRRGVDPARKVLSGVGMQLLGLYIFVGTDSRPDIRFQSSLVTNTAKNGALAEQKETLARAYGWLVVNGLLAALAGSAPRSATQNLVELLSAFSLRYPAETRVWVSEVLFAVRLLSELWRSYSSCLSPGSIPQRLGRMPRTGLYKP
jgi:hypothetical protein